MSDVTDTAPEPKRRKAEAAPVTRARPNDELIARRAARKKRGVTDHGFDKRLPVPEHLLDTQNFVYRKVSDTPGRVERLRAVEWEVVAPEEVGGQDVRRHAGSDKDGQPMQVVLMKKPKDWYQEDAAEKAGLLKEQDAALMRGRVSGPGKADYASPNNSISTETGRVRAGTPPEEFQP
jgi:hypothetical protein